MSGPRLQVLGIDPGLASLGVARLTVCGGDICASAARVIETKRATKKARVALRTSADDLRRAEVLWRGMADLAAGADAVAYEVYQPFQSGPRRTASGHKTATACGLAMALGFSLGVPVIPVLPADVKREACGRASASKADVERALRERVAGLDELLEQIRPRKREHASDAAAIALVGIAEIRRWPRIGGAQ